MRLSSLGYLTRQGYKNLALNALMTVASVAVLTTCLFITGIAFLFTVNLDSLVAYLGTQNETVVYLDPRMTEEETKGAYDEIVKIEGISQATLMSKQDVLETYRGYLEEYSDLWDRFEEDNPFKANYRVTITDLENMSEIQRQLQTIHGVVKVSAPVEMAGIFVELQQAVSIAGYVLVGALALVSLVVISNTVRLTVFARHKEIEIMKYVGATNGFIRWPFFVEGVTVGLLSALLSAGLVLGAYYGVLYAVDGMTGMWKNMLGTSLIPFETIAPYVAAGCAIIGVVVGGLGSVVSIRKHLKV